MNPPIPGTSSGNNLPRILNGTLFQVTKIGTGTNVKAKCVSCEQKGLINEISGSTTATSNFRTHYKRKHPSDLTDFDSDNEVPRKKSKSAGPVLEQLQPVGIRKLFDVNERKQLQKSFDDDVMNYVVGGMKPLSTVEESDFKTMFKRLDPQIHVMSRRTLTRNLIKKQKSIEQNLRDQFQKIEFVTTTADIWSTKHRSYMGSTAHWIDDDSLGRKSAVLACDRFSGSHDYINVAKMLTNIHNKYNLRREQIVSTVTDNGSNFVKAFREFKYSSPDRADDDSLDGQSETDGEEETTDGEEESLDDEDDECREESTDDEEDLEFVSLETPEPAYDSSSNDSPSSDGSDITLPKHVRCGSHTVSLVGTTDYQKALKTNSSVATTHKTALSKCGLLWKKFNRPKSAEIITGHLQASLKTPCVTRWNSLYDSVSHLLQFKEDLNVLMKQLKLKQTFTKKDLDYLTEFCVVMRPIAGALDRLQRENDCYYGFFMPTLFAAKQKLEVLLTPESSQTLKYLHRVLPSLIVTFKSRFKDFFTLSPEANDAIIASSLHPAIKMRWLPEELHDRIPNIKKLCVDAIVGLSKTTPGPTVEASPDDDDYFILHNNQNSAGSVETEFYNFLNDRSKELASLNNYPRVRRAFIKFNTTLCASAAVERLFSFANLILCPNRRSLSDKNFRMLVCLKGNRNYFQN